MSSFSEPKSESTIRLEIGKPFGVGMNTTEGERLLKALRKIQHKLNHQKSYSSDRQLIDNKSTNPSIGAFGDHYVSHKSNKCTNTSIVETDYNQYSNQLIETRLQLIEKQLQNILQLMANNNNNNINTNEDLSPNANVNNPYPTPSPSAISGTEDQIGLNLKSVDTFVHIRNNKTKSNKVTITKSKSYDAINKANPSKHFHLQYKDIPFLLGTVSQFISILLLKSLKFQFFFI
jgi:hypothetical protein